ncbi:MAG: divalent metal cation transporter [Pirellulaceae bacterium]
MSENLSKVESDREVLKEAQAQGTGATLGAWVKLSGPGWLQSAITLGGGSLSGALFLGILGGTNLLWLQLVAIFMGVIMLSAITYVTLSTGERPFRQINKHINPVLGWGWIVATCAANMIFCMPQFGLCYAALDKNLLPGVIDGSLVSKLTVSALILLAAGTLVIMNSRRGLAAKIFDWVLKGMIGIIVLCFFGVVVRLGYSGAFDWGEVLSGFIPDLRAISQPVGRMAEMLAEAPEKYQQYWSTRIVDKQKAAMIGAAATAVGINMTFLLPYSMLSRGWDKTFRGLARFDLSTGMAIPYILVTSCVVIASASAFHLKADAQFLSSSFEEMQTSPIFTSDARGILSHRVAQDIPAELREAFLNNAPNPSDELKTLKAEATQEIEQRIPNLSDSEKLLAASLVNRNEFLLSSALAPLLPDGMAQLVFGIGIFGMGFSTIIILMMINGYAFTEIADGRPNGRAHVLGCLVAGISGASWFFIWDGDAKVWLSILVSSFAIMFLPIAYVTFFLMMNSRRILGKELPTGMSSIIWNVLMGISVIGAIGAAYTAISGKVMSPATDPTQKAVLLTVVVGYLVLVAIGFYFRSAEDIPADTDA